MYIPHTRQLPNGNKFILSLHVVKQMRQTVERTNLCHLFGVLINPDNGQRYHNGSLDEYDDWETRRYGRLGYWRINNYGNRDGAWEHAGVILKTTKKDWDKFQKIIWKQLPLEESYNLWPLPPLRTKTLKHDTGPFAPLWAISAFIRVDYYGMPWKANPDKPWALVAINGKRFKVLKRYTLDQRQLAQLHLEEVLREIAEPVPVQEVGNQFHRSRPPE